METNMNANKLSRDNENLFSVVSSMAGNGNMIATTRRDSVLVYDLTLDNSKEQHLTLPEGRWQVIYLLLPDSGEIVIEFVKAL